ncbi:Exonuclease [Eumeta japonica]|uniref:Exonuclease n=1 Tax=Eumeta variegata TaxID=151549 RepID=A0A4C1V2M8_EUMVA|nr:Exonuclease [Eumeta japonica]
MGSIPDTRAMKRGRLLENEVRKTVGKKLGKKIKKCGLMLSKEYTMIAGSPDGICENSIIEIKCPTSAKTYQNYINNGKPTEKFNTQMQMQMYLTGLQKGYFCVADSNYSTNKKVEIISVTYDETYMSDFLKLVVDLWKENVYPVLYQSTL